MVDQQRFPVPSAPSKTAKAERMPPKLSSAQALKVANTSEDLRTAGFPMGIPWLVDAGWWFGWKIP